MTPSGSTDMEPSYEAVRPSAAGLADRLVHRGAVGCGAGTEVRAVAGDDAVGVDRHGAVERGGQAVRRPLEPRRRRLVVRLAGAADDEVALDLGGRQRPGV